MREDLNISRRKLVSVTGSIVAILMAFGVTGCSEENAHQPVIVDAYPSAPDGVFSVTGDGQVEICWNLNPENDIAGYDIYWNDEATGYYEYVATVGPSQTCYIDTDVTNGVTYFLRGVGV